jgi:fibronectin-binding autotransporter adhesin
LLVDKKPYFMKQLCNSLAARILTIFIAAFILFSSQNVQAQNADVTISTSATSGGTWSGSSPNWTFTPNSGASSANILNTDLQAKLGTGGAGSNVTINTQTTSGTGNGDITVSATVTLPSINTISSNFTLTLNANRNITISSAITLNGGTGACCNIGAGDNLSLTAANGSISISSAISANGGSNVGGGGGAGYNAGNITVTAGTTVSISAAISATGGNTGRSTNAAGNSGSISITGPGGVSITTAGTLTANGGNGTSGGSGVNGNGGSITISDGANTITSGGTNDGILSVMSALAGSFGNGAGTAGTFTKSGSGTLLISGANTYIGGTTISAGTLSLGAANTLPSSGNITLSGGTLQTGAGAGFSQTTSGTLIVSANSSIALGTGSHTLTFANSSAATWAATSLTITGWTGTANSSGTAGKVNFGSASGLAAGQLSKILWTTGTGAALLSSPAGELVPTSTGTPTISSTGSLSAVSTTYGTASGTASFSVSGTNMAAGILVTPPAGFEVSTDNSTFTSTLTVGSGGTINATTVYVRLKATASVGSTYNSQNVALTSSGASTVNVATASSGNTVTARALTITANNVSKIYGNTLTGGSGSAAFTSSGLQNSETIGSVTIAYGTGAASGDAVATYTASVTPSAATGGTFTAGNYTISYVNGDIIVNPAPAISAIGSPLSSMSTTYGTASVSASFSVSGTNMLADILVTPPAGFEVSTNNSTFTSTVTVGSSGTISSTTVYVRFTATTTPGSYNSQNIILTSSSATTINVATASSGNTVAQATSVLTVTGGSVYAFTGSALGPNSSTNPAIGAGLAPTGTVTYSYSGTGSTTYGPSATRPSAAGTYSVTASYPGDANYNSTASSAFAFSIISFTGKISNGTGGGIYATGSSWTGGVAPTSSDNIYIQASDVITLGANTSTSGAVNVYGTLQMANFTFGASGDLAGTGTITNTGTSVLTITPPVAGATFPGTIAGSLALTKAGANSLTLSGTNTYTGLTTVSAGTLKLGSSSALGTTAAATSVTSGAVLDLNGITYSTAEGLTLAGTGISSGGALINSNSTAASYAGNITLSTTAPQVTANNPITLSGIISGGNASGTNSLTVAGNSTLAGALTLSGNNTYTGYTTINSGALLKIGTNNALGAGAPNSTTDAGDGNSTYITSGGVLDLNGITYTQYEGIQMRGTGFAAAGNGCVINSSSTAAIYSGCIDSWTSSTLYVVNPITFNGMVQFRFGNSITKTGSGTMTLAPTGGDRANNSFLTVSEGTLKLGVNFTEAGSTSIYTRVLSGAVLDLNGFTCSRYLYLNGTGISSGGALINSSATPATHSGLVILESASSIVGDAGTIALTNTGTMTGATFGLTLGGASGGSIASIIGTTSGTLTKVDAGTWTLSRANTYTGLTTISAGTLKLGNAAALGTNAAGTIVSSGGALDMNGINYSTAEALTLNGTGVSGGGALMNSSATGATFAGLVTLGSSGSIVGGTGTIALSNTGTITGSGFGLTLGGAQGGSIASIINLGTGSITKADAGTWTFNNGQAITAGDLGISAGTLSATSGTMNLSGNISNSGTFTHNSGTVNLNGSSGQTITGASTFNNLTINNAAGITLASDVTYNATLTLTSGIITTGSNNLIAPSTANVSRTSGHIFGNFKKWIPNTATRTFQIGTATDYTPMDVTFASVTTAGYVTGKSTAGDHPSVGSACLDANKSVNVYYSLTNNTATVGSFSIAFTYLAGNVDGSAIVSGFNVKNYSGGSWSAALTVSPTPTTTLTTITGVSSFGDYAIADLTSIAATISASGPTSFCSGNSVMLTANNGDSYLWSTGATTSFITVSSAGTYSVTVTMSGCTATSPATTVTVNSMPSAPTVTGASGCSGNSVSLGASGSPSTYNWYAASSGGSSLASTATYNTPSLSSTTTYYVSAVNSSSCESTPRTAVVATISSSPSVSSATPGAVCDAGTVTLGAAASAGTLNWYTASTGGTSQGTGTSFITPEISSSTTYYVDATSNGCTSARTAIIATVNSTPSVSSATPGSVCGSGTATLGATASAGTLNWYTVSAGGTSQGSGTSFTTPGISNTTTYYVDATSNSCTSARTAVTATVHSLPVPTITPSGTVSVCSGAGISLSSSSADSYLWSNSCTAQSTTVSSAGTYTVTVTDENGCQGTSAGVVVQIIPCTFTWDGSESSDWNTGGNWDIGFVPDASDSIVIPASLVNMPVISSAVFSRSLTINSGASLTNSASGVLTVAGDLTVNGSYTDAGTIVFNGTSAQVISGKVTFKNVSLNNASGLSLNDTCIITGILTLANGQLNTNGKLNIDLNQGAIAYNASDNGSISGNLRVSKNISCHKTHYLSSPLGGTTVNEFYDDAVVIEPSTSMTRLFSWNSSTQAWTGIYGTSTSLDPMSGYSLYFLNPSVLDFTGTYSHSAGTYSTSVTATAANQSVVIGNPYPSALDWESSGWTRSNVKGAVNYWNACLGKYSSYTIGGASTNGGTQYIPAMQSFIVQTVAAGTASVTVNNTARTTSFNPSLWRHSAGANTLKLTLSSGVFSDETVIRFNENAIDGFDNDLDAPKFKNPDLMPSFYSVNGNEEYSINTLPISEERIIPLNIEPGFSGTYTITVQEIAPFDVPYILILKDKLMNSSKEILDSSYTFQVNQGQGTNRFELEYRTSAAQYGSSSAASVSITGFENTIKVKCSNASGQVDLYIYNSIGQLISSDSFDASKEYSNVVQNIISGIYVVKVVTAEGVYSSKVFLNE